LLSAIAAIAIGNQRGRRRKSTASFAAFGLR
jgi:hypothetical protein